MAEESDKIILNIGGTIFLTVRNTLQKSEAFTELMGDPSILRDNDNSILIDRDHTHFRHILNYLRDTNMVPELNPSKRKELLAEARFYHMPGLIAKLESQIADSSTDGSNKSWFSRGGRSKYATKRRHRHNK